MLTVDGACSRFAGNAPQACKAMQNIAALCQGGDMPGPTSSWCATAYTTAVVYAVAVFGSCQAYPAAQTNSDNGALPVSSHLLFTVRRTPYLDFPTAESPSKITLTLLELASCSAHQPA
eukprot:GHRR01007821.1.p2 GENE.GHRR01007821.1~~GHRR01007821.1.p2  ORF type:complete len:119 (+),score=15.50 GHRR01007821.1:1487-1843(+)